MVVRRNFCAYTPLLGAGMAYPKVYHPIKKAQLSQIHPKSKGDILSEASI